MLRLNHFHFRLRGSTSEGVPLPVEPALLASAARMAERSQHGVSEGQDVRSERPATRRGQPRWAAIPGALPIVTAPASAHAPDNWLQASPRPVQPPDVGPVDPLLGHPGTKQPTFQITAQPGSPRGG